MSEFHEIPDPKPAVAGRNNRVVMKRLRQIVANWRPRGARETGVATISRFAHRVMGSDGQAYTADELGSGTAATILDKLKGAEADPDRIGAEYLPVSFEGSLKLADTGASAEEAGILGLNSAGRMVIHDGDSDGDNLNPFLDRSDLMSFYKAIAVTEMNNAFYKVKVASLRLSAARAAADTFIRATGQLYSRWLNSNKPNYGAFLVLAPAGYDPALGEGLHLPFGTGATDETRLVQLAVKLTGTTSVEFASASTAAMCLNAKNSAGTITHAKEWVWASDALFTSGSSLAAAGVAQDLELWLFTADDSGIVNAALELGGYLNFVFAAE